MTRGYFIGTDPEGKVVDEGESLRCVHCGLHFIVRPGSGRERGFCLRCLGALCGAQACMERCVPWERQVEAAERRARLRAAVTRNFGV